MEPDFISQTAEPMSKSERRRWFEELGGEFSRQGATHFRLTAHETIQNLLFCWRRGRCDRKTKVSRAFNLRRADCAT
jgi:hypothetical protein